MGISAVVITKNEEDRINRCLDSLKDWVDEIIIVDDLSSDNTVKIAKEYGAKVIINESKGNFDQQRNLGIKNATSEWVLQMDADEVIPNDTAKKIKEAIENPKEFVAFELRRRNFLLDYPLRYGGSYLYGIKLFKKEKAYYTGKIHETLKVEGKVGRIEADIYHYPLSSINKIMEKTIFYTDIEAELFLRNNPQVSFKQIRYLLTWKALKSFWKLYVKKKGYKDGMYGLVWCILNVIGPQIRWLKIWEKMVNSYKQNNKNGE